MKYFKMLCLILTSLNSFSYNILSKEEEQFALKYYTQVEINRLDEWIFDLANTENEIENGKPFKMPHVKFYDNEKLTGTPFAFIDDKGLNVYEKYACIRKIYDGDSEYIIDPEKIKIENYHIGVGDKVVPAQREIIEGGVLCPYIPLEKWGARPNETLDIKFRVPVINERIGKFKMGGQDVYFDIVEWANKYMVEKSAKVILKNILTTKDLDDIGDLILGLRKVLEKGSMQDIYNYIMINASEDSRKSQVFSSVKIEHAIHRIISPLERERAIKSTLIANRKYIYNPSFDTSRKSQSVFLTFFEGDGRVFFKLEKNEGQWRVYKFDLFGVDTDSSGD